MFAVWKKRFGMEEDSFTAPFLSSFNLKTLRSIVNEMKAEIQKASQHLVHSLVDKDKTVKQHEDRLQIVSEMLTKYAEANGLKTEFRFNIRFTDHYNDIEYCKWCGGWSLVSQIGSGIIKEWRNRVWEGVATYCTRDINWDSFIHHLMYQSKVSDREIEWEKSVELSLKQVIVSSVDNIAAKQLLLTYCKLFPQSVYCHEFTTLASIIVKMNKDDEILSLKVLVTLLEHKLPPQYFAEGFQSVKSDILVLNELIKHFLPQLSEHMQLLRSRSSAQVLKHYSFQNPPSVNDCTSFEPPLLDALSLQWFLSCFTTCLPWKIIKRVIDSWLIDGSEMLLYTALAIWMLMESELIKVDSVPDFYEQASKVIDQLKNGTLVLPAHFIQIVYTIRQCCDEQLSIKKLRAKHFTSNKNTPQKLTPFRPPPSQGGSLLVTRPPQSSPIKSDVAEVTPVTAVAECPQIKKSGFIFSYAYAADVPVDLPVKHAMKFSKNCTKLLKDGAMFSLGDCADLESMYLFTDPAN